MHEIRYSTVLFSLWKNIQITEAALLLLWGELNGGYAWNPILHNLILPQENMLIAQATLLILGGELDGGYA